MKTELVSNVDIFLERTAAMYGRIHEKRFKDEMTDVCLEKQQSPIEDMFLIACHALAFAHYVQVNANPERGDDGDWQVGDGLHIQAQKQIGIYRVDFFIFQKGIGPNEILLPVVVELDGHAFHDKDKKQRSYEKARDRYLVKQGYRVLHYTGADVVADPFKAAFEVLDLLGLSACSCSELGHLAFFNEASNA